VINEDNDNEDDRLAMDMDQEESCDNEDSSWHPRLPLALAASLRDAQPRESLEATNRRAINHQAKTSKPSDEQGFVISKILTQNAHGLRRRARDNEGNLCPNLPHDYTRYEHLITNMKLKGIDVYFIQETWLEGDVFDETINGYHIFRHNREVGNHNFHGVAIILSPRYHKGWKATGARPPITTNAKGEFAGRFISLNIKLASNDRTGKTI
jgi:hypothetical protein